MKDIQTFFFYFQLKYNFIYFKSSPNSTDILSSDVLKISLDSENRKVVGKFSGNQSVNLEDDDGSEDNDDQNSVEIQETNQKSFILKKDQKYFI